MANVQHLADVAMQIFRSGGATSIGSAARQAVRRSGITYKLDVKRISSEVCRALQQRSTATKLRKRRLKQQGMSVTKRHLPQQLSFHF